MRRFIIETIVATAKALIRKRQFRRKEPQTSLSIAKLAPVERRDVSF